MGKITVTRPSEHALDELGVRNWPIWTCDASTFDWHYDQAETFYILEGKVTITAGQQKATIQPGDLVVCPEGLDCLWEVHSPVRKHYKFG